MIHERKCWLEPFAAIVAGAKTADIRRDDREETFTVGDTLVLREWDPLCDRPTFALRGYTGRTHERTVTHVERQREFVPAGYVVLSLETPQPIPAAEDDDDDRDSDDWDEDEEDELEGSGA